MALDPVDTERAQRAAAAKLTWGVWIVVMGAAAVFLAMPRSAALTIGAGFNPASILVKPGQEVVQSFRAGTRDIDNIDLRVLKVSAPGFASAAVEFSLKEQLAVRRTHKVALQDLSGRRSWHLGFEPIDGSREGVYRIRIRVEGTPESSGLVLATAEGHEYADGELFIDGEEQAVDLVMKANGGSATAWRALQSLTARRLGWGGWIWAIAIGYGTLVLMILRGFVSLTA